MKDSLVSDSKAVFSGIYDNKIWHGGSGAGSDPDNTAAYRAFVEDYIKSNNIRSVIDLGCGNWSSSRLINWDGVEYLGIDVVASVIKENIRKHAKPGISFQAMDFYKGELPDAGLVIVKDVMQHWPSDMVNNFIPKLRKYKHSLITNTSIIYDSEDDSELLKEPAINSEIELGRMRPIDLSKPPFGHKVKELFLYNSRLEKGAIGVWEVKSTVTIVD